MKRSTLVFILTFALCLGTGLPFGPTASFAAAEDPGAYSWSGKWDTNWGEMELTQTGSKVTGTYTYDHGKIEGTVSGNTLTGTWAEEPSYAPPNDGGEVEFVMSEDGKTFTGKWRYGSDGSWGNWDGGTRLTQVVSNTPPKDYGNASSWAVSELDKAAEYGLIPDSLKSADLTKPITREEFAELGVRLYEEATGTSAAAASPNPFTDTTNPEILKAFKLGVTNGTSATAFSPKVLINREQCAAMLFRTINAIHPGGDYSITGIPDFPDQKSISAYAVPATKYMSKLGIVKGDAKGYFMPKATTTAQTAAGYGMATREAAILMSVRTYDKVDAIKATQAPAVPETPAPVTPPADSQTPPAPTEKEANNSLIGSWMYTAASGNVGLAIMMDFHADGTFIRALGSVAGYSYSATAYEGKYRISGDKIVFYDQKKSTGYASSWEELWTISYSQVKDIPAEDDQFTFSWTESGNLIIGGSEYGRLK